MNYIIRIFFRSSSPISLREVIEAAEEGEFLFEDPKFDPNPDVQPTDIMAWTSLKLTWDSRKDPIVFRNHYEDDELRKEIRELSHILSISRPSKPAQRVTDHLKQTVRMLEIEMNRDELTDEAWVMLDAIESGLAKKYDGIISTQEGAFFDQNLKRLYKL